MQTSQDVRRNDFDMAKLQKSLKQQQHRSFKLRHTVTKLTPAEIRSLNHSATSSRGRSNSGPSVSQRPVANTPPLTPDNAVPTQAFSNRNSVSLPTPPHSPDHALPQRQNSNPGNGLHIHSPIPQSHSKAGFVLTTTNSRPPSASSHRAMPTYRGPEITNIGQHSMLHPSILTHQIVDNPLSQFSRPRQSRGSVSPTRQEQRLSNPNGQSDTRSYRSRSVSAVRTSSDTPERPDRIADSPVSAMEDETELETQPGPEPFHQTESNLSQPAQQIIIRSQTIAVDGSIPQESHSRFSWSWRKSLPGHKIDNNNDSEVKKPRRRTMSWSKGNNSVIRTVPYQDTKAGDEPEKRQSLQGELPSHRMSAESAQQEAAPTEPDAFATHPAVHPLSPSSEALTDAKGKMRDNDGSESEVHDVAADDSIPMYSRCSCCGRLRKPSGNRSLSPVLENENLKTNFAVELERVNNMDAGRKRSSSGASQKYTPILPMMTHSGDTVQAKIGPMEDVVQEYDAPMVVVNERGDIIAPGSEPVTWVPTASEERSRTIVRFSSLYLKEEARKRTDGAKKLTKSGLRHEMGTIQDTPMNNLVGSQLVQDRNSPRRYTDTAVINNGRSHPLSRFETHSDEPTGELMAATNGVDFPAHVATTQIERNNGATGMNDWSSESARMKNGPSVSNFTEPTTLDTRDSTNARERAKSLETDRQRLRFVSFSTEPVEQRPSTSTPTSSIYQRKPALRQTAPVPTNENSQGPTTRPKSTAQYMYRGSVDLGTSYRGVERSDQFLPQPVRTNSSLVESVLAASNRDYSQRNSSRFGR